LQLLVQTSPAVVSETARCRILPFLKRSQEASGSGPAPTVTREPDEPQDLDGIEVAAQDVLDAVKRSDPKALAEAMKAMFQMMEMEPHDEVSHEEDEE
jgi:hypothetical protein